MYQKETFPKNIRFVRDNPYNRNYLTKKIGKPKFLLESESVYIEIGKPLLRFNGYIEIHHH